MTSIDDYASEVRDVYAEALLSARLKGIEGVPAKRLAAENAAETINRRHETEFNTGDVMHLLRIKDKAPFSLIMSNGQRRTDRKADEPILDQRMLALLSQLNDTVHSPKT